MANKNQGFFLKIVEKNLFLLKIVYAVRHNLRSRKINDRKKPSWKRLFEGTIFDRKNYRKDKDNERG